MSPSDPRPLSAAEPTTYAWDADTAIPMEEWGRDHWSTLAYVETCAVDRGGVLGNAHMRCNPRHHRRLTYVHPLGRASWDDKYSTRLNGGRVAVKHDDWSCLEDMEAAGLLTSSERNTKPRATFGGVTVRVKLTATGLAIAAQLRTHKARGGSFATFTPEPSHV